MIGFGLHKVTVSRLVNCDRDNRESHLSGTRILTRSHSPCNRPCHWSRTRSRAAVSPPLRYRVSAGNSRHKRTRRIGVPQTATWSFPRSRSCSPKQTQHLSIEEQLGLWRRHRCEDWSLGALTLLEAVKHQCRIQKTGCHRRVPTVFMTHSHN